MEYKEAPPVVVADFEYDVMDAGMVKATEDMLDAVAAAEHALGREPRDVSDQRGIGHDIESKDLAIGLKYLIEVKGRAGADDHVTLSRCEVLRFGQPGFAQTSSKCSPASLLARGGPPV